MAKTKKKPAPPPPDVTPAPEPPKLEQSLTPQRVCELLGLPAPLDPPRPPAPWPGYATFWDPGRSIADLKRKHRPRSTRCSVGMSIRCLPDRLLCSTGGNYSPQPLLLEASFAEQAERSPKGDNVHFGPRPDHRAPSTITRLHVSRW